MAMPQFNSKTFNAEAFGSYVDTIPQPNKNELIKSRVIVADEQVKTLLSSQTQSYYATIPFFGRIDGDPVNYDGQTDIPATSTETFTQSIVAFGRAKAWTEKDFSYDITAGVDFLSQAGRQIAEYWDDRDTITLTSIINGIFSMTGTKNLEFVNGHTYDISGETTDNVMTATTLNTAVQKALGDKRSKLTMVFMHSAVATNLENMNLLQYLKYTDSQGIQRSLPLATWNGRMVIIDDGMPTEEVDDGGTKYTKYTTYIFGEGAFKYADIGAKVPFEMSRDPKTNGGEDTLYSRRRLAFVPYGISYTKASQATLSPTDTELATGANWTLINNGKSGGSLKVIDHKEIPIARIFSRG